MMNKALTTEPRLRPGRRIYVVGDVHGHSDTLARAHAKIRADLDHRPTQAPMLVHLGDLIDRGPDSAGCIDLLAAGPPIRGVPTINLMGNHEHMLLTAIDRATGDDIYLWLDNGGDKALASWGLKSSTRPAEWLAAIPPKHLVFIRDLALHHVEQGYAFVHAGVRPGIPLAKQRDIDLLWIRDAFLEWTGVMLPEAPARIVVHGHTPTARPVLKPNRIGLDTGAGKGGILTCAVLEGDEIGLFEA